MLREFYTSINAVDATFASDKVFDKSAFLKSLIEIYIREQNIVLRRLQRVYSKRVYDLYNEVLPMSVVMYTFYAH